MTIAETQRQSMVDQLRMWVEARHAEVMGLPFTWIVLVDLMPHRENGLLWISTDKRVAQAVADRLAKVGGSDRYAFATSVEFYQIMLDMQLSWVERVLAGEKGAGAPAIGHRP